MTKKFKIQMELSFIFQPLKNVLVLIHECEKSEKKECAENEGIRAFAGKFR